MATPDPSDLYPLQPFRIRSRESLLAVIKAYPLATVFSTTEAGSQITLIPLLPTIVDDNVHLLGHVDANNPHGVLLKKGRFAHFAFQSPSSYASPDLYTEPQLPGWLYVAVQGTGEIVAEHTREEARKVLLRATREFGEPTQRFKLRNDDPRIDRFIGGITAFELRVTEMHGIAKLAQDKGRASAEIAAEFLARDRGVHAPLFKQLLGESRYP